MNKSFAIYILLATLIALVRSATFVVEVGYDRKLQFFPNDFPARTGDSVLFKFVSGKHDVVQSDGESCVKSTNPNAFQSENNPPSKEFTMTISQTSGNIWYFCSVHCESDGMKGVIRVTSNDTSKTSDAIRSSNSFTVIGLGALASNFFFWL